MGFWRRSVRQWRNVMKNKWMSMNKKEKLRWGRNVVQLMFFVLFPALSERTVKWLQKLKYLILVFVLLLCYMGQGEQVGKNSPWTFFSMITAGRFPMLSYAVSAVLLIVILIGMAVHERFFCQFLCPMGAVFSLLPESPLFAMKRKAQNCIPNCQLCKKQCPVSVNSVRSHIGGENVYVVENVWRPVPEKI